MFGLAATTWFLVTAPPLLRAEYLPDDAFYYLTLARHRAVSGTWTFDGGVSVTTGFHLLQGYALALLFAANPTTAEPFVREAVILSLAVLIPALAVAATFVIRANRLLPALLLALFALSRNVALNAPSAMEWSWVVTLSVGYAVALVGLGRRPTAGGAACLFACGAVGSLARSDFGLMPAAMFAAVLVLPGLATDLRRHFLLGAGAGVAGAACGVAIMLIHNVAVSGQALQSSASVKWSWLAVYGPALTPILFKVEWLFGRSSRTTWIAAAVMIAAMSVRGLGEIIARPALDGAAVSRRIVWLGSLLTVGGYTVFYSLNPAVQHWYTANLVGPLFILLTFPALGTRPAHPLMLAATGAALVLLLGQFVQIASFSRIPEYPHQRAMAEAGQYLQDHPPDGRIGAWNAGLVGYYQGGAIINLDGLVNNESAAYAARANLPAYLDARSIAYVVDDPLMLESVAMRRAGGYDDDVFVARLRPIRRFGPPYGIWTGETLYKVMPAR
jgi:hypothetical protein